MTQYAAQGAVPLQAVPWQTLNTTILGQAVTLNIYQRGGVIYMDMALNGTWLFYGRQCFNENAMVRSAYFGFAGDLVFYDTQGSTDPVYSGLGSRYVLIYYA